MADEHTRARRTPSAAPPAGGSPVPTEGSGTPAVVYVTTVFPTMASFVENEVRGLLARGVNVRVFTLRALDAHHQSEHSGLLAVTRWAGSTLDPLGWLELARWAWRRPGPLTRSVSRLLWASRGSFYALAGHAAYLPAAARIAAHVEREGVPHVHAAFAHFPGSVAWLVAQLTGCTFSVAAHAGGDLLRTRAFLADKLRAARFTTACAACNADMLRRIGGGSANVLTVYHGVNRSRFDGRGRHRDDEPLLLAVGRYAKTKGFDVAIRAVALLAARGRHVRLLLVGEGLEREHYEDLIRGLGLEDQVVLAGERAQQDLVPLYRRAWLLLAPSRRLANGRCDSIPNVIAEAMAMGVPCLGTQVGGIREAVADGMTGRLCEPDDPVAFARTIEDMLADPEALDQMGECARADARERFDAARNFERLFALMCPLLGGGRTDGGPPGGEREGQGGTTAAPAQGSSGSASSADPAGTAAAHCTSTNLLVATPPTASTRTK